VFGRIRSHKLYIPLLTIFGLAAVFCAYSFLYVSSQETYANERAFRLLSVIGDQLTKHFDNLKSVMAAALVYSPGDASPRTATERTAEYIKRVAGHGDEISIVKANLPCPNDWKREGAIKLYLLPNQANFALEAIFESALDRGLPVCSIDAKVDPAAEFRERFHNLTSDYFDDILIATSTGEVLFESNLTGLRISSLETLGAPQLPNAAVKPEPDAKDARPKASPFRDVSQFSNVRDVRLAGGVYKLYMQPVPLQIFADKKENQTVKTVICGLWRADRQQSALVSIPYATLIWGVLGVLAVFGLLWPLLKVAYMSPTERLKRLHVFFLISSSLFVTGVLTTLVLNGAYMSRLDDDAHRQLEDLAAAIDKNVKAELARALILMNRLECPYCYTHDVLAKATDKEWTRTRILEEPSVRNALDLYPYFDNIFWADRDGRQLFKITVHGEATPQTSVADTAYFRAVRDGQRLKSLPWRPIADANIDPVEYETALATKFHLETLYSTNTGEYFVVLAKPAQAKGLPRYLSGSVAEVLVTKFISLQQPVLPAGFGYAVVDHDGLVQFHSSEGRNQIEDFFKESRENPVIQAMVAAGTTGYADVDYDGRQQLMRVLPLPYLADPGLTLIVFRDTNYFRMINMACILTFGFLGTMLGAPAFCLLALCIARRGSYPLERMWPDGGRRASYIGIVVAAACAAAAFVIRYPEMEIVDALRSVLALSTAALLLAAISCARPHWSEEIKVAIAAIAIVAISGWSWALLAAGVYLALSLNPTRRRISKLAERCNPKSLYVAAVFSLLAAGVVLPCFGIFKIAYHSISALAIETALQDRADLLMHRSEAIRDRFSDPEIAPADNNEQRGGRVSIVVKRIQEGLDRYDRPVFAPRGLKLPEDVPPRVSQVDKKIAELTAWFPNNTFGGQLRQATMADFRDKNSPWVAGVVDGYEIIALKQVPEGLREKSLRGVYPVWRVGREHVLILALLGLLLIVWLRYMARKLFLTELEQAPPLEPWSPPDLPDSGLVIIGDPESGRAAAAARIPAKDWIDLAQTVVSGSWSLPELKENVVVVDNFEFDIESPESCQAKLKLLEELVFVRRKQVVLLSTVDPIFHAEACGQMLERWVAVLGGLQKLVMDDRMLNPIDAWVTERALSKKFLPEGLVALILEECNGFPHLRRVGIGILGRHVPGSAFSHARIMEELMDRADTFYRMLWTACANQERLVLFQLARDGWANPKNARAIRQLERRGLVRRTPALRILNESFRRFVWDAQLPAEVKKWEEEVQNSTWSALKLGFTTAAFAGGAWLLYTQQEIFQAGTGYLAALGTASGAVISLARSLSLGKAGASPDK
jgi:hypothetical protein